MQRAERKISALTSAIQASFSDAGALVPCAMQPLLAGANTHTPSRSCPRHLTGQYPVSRPKMIKTFSLSALFFLSIGLLIVNASQLPIA
jgi:hypothetical protein